MFDLKNLFAGFDIKSQKKYKEIFGKLKIYFIFKINEFLDGKKHTLRGRKRTVDWDRFFDCLFYICDNGMKMSYIKDVFNISKSTYYYYFDLITKSKFLEKLYNDIVKSYSPLMSEDYLITDTFTVKSMNGSEGLGRNCTDRGRKGLKVSLICNQNLITHAVYLGPANVHDSKLLEPTIRSSISNLEGKKCLADSGYAGTKYISKIKKETDVVLISKPKRTNNKLKMSHVVSYEDSELLQKKRNYIERLNGNLRNFRGLMIKYTKKISSYLTYLYVALICITCHRIFIYD
jgi:hypothetical protein